MGQNTDLETLNIAHLQVFLKGPKDLKPYKFNKW